MSKIHQWKEWIKYKSIARSRHGVHSPFVYKFIEEVLHNRNQEDLKQRIIDYFKEYDIGYNEWSLEKEILGDKLIILDNIHGNAAATLKWSAISLDSRVRLSIDLYKYGLLFFKKDLLQKQHFVLKA